MSGNYRRGIEKILQGILRYRHNCKDIMVSEFKKVKENHEPSAVLFTCVDSRMLPSRFTQTDVGDMLIVRNAANMIPNALTVDSCCPATEPAVLELGCLMNNVKHVIVCGHSDCKAINMLYSKFRRNNKVENINLIEKSPLKAWLHRHGFESLKRYEMLESDMFQQPLHLSSLVCPVVSLIERPIKAYIDVDAEFNEADRLSQINTLLQVENVCSYAFMRKAVQERRVILHAMWFDMCTGNIFYFSQRQERFVLVLEENVDNIIDDALGGP